MPELINEPVRVEAAGTLPKLIDEYTGRASTGEPRLSIAHMRSPAGWAEPGQRPEFDEYTLVLRGLLVVESETGELRVQAWPGGARPAGRMGPLQHPGRRWCRVHLGLRPGVQPRDRAPRRMTGNAR